MIPPPWKYDTPETLRILDVRSHQALAAHAEAWTELLQQSPVATPMLSYPQVSAFFETQVHAPQEWMCLFIYQQDRLLAVFPLVAARTVGVPGLRMIVMKTPYDIMHTGGVDCLTLHGREDLVEVMLDYLSKMPGAWPIVRIREIPEDSPSMVCRNRPGSRLPAIRRDHGGENFIRVPATMEEFHAGLSSNFRRQLKRGRKKLDELKDVRVLCREQSRTHAENMRRFVEVENAGWKGAESTSVMADENNTRLLALAAERFGKHGLMEWNFIETEGRSIAAHYAVRVNRTLFLLKIGYDESHSACSPGNLLLEEVIANACRNGDIDEINCVAECAWHRNWAMENRRLHELVLLPKLPAVSGLLAMLLRSSAFHRMEERLSRKPTPAIT
jgi:CelD/BcsL family acetyltransferase involved in cellulose biosynthesis